ncbi:odorant receptor 10a-like [Nymphalis io]|uniref:odorant receptor 10a-like n=1 Tax=Inachis io TaxID=171585 RepID=UPI002167468C|nr:odorant receptor 10a-like [Nymphalis io]
MKYFDKFGDFLKNIKDNLNSNHLESIIWLVNIFPNRAGFSILKEKVSAPFWIVHLSLLVYVYGVGSVVYQMQFAQGAGDFVKSYVNISILILTANSSYWFLMKRRLLLTVLEQVNLNDKLSRATDFLRKKHEKLLSTIKKILFTFYGFNLFDALFIYLPHRIDVSNDYYSMTLCYGLEPLTSSPNREICLAILFTQEITIMTVVLNYQGLLLFIIAHTSAMYEMLSAEMLVFDENNDNMENQLPVRQRLPSLIRRHALTLSIIKNIKALYSMPFGVNFGSNAVCICLFFYLPLYAWITFIPVLVYCFLVFFLYCFLCQRLINSSEMFANAVYSCGWEKFALKEKKMIYVMLMVAHKPIELLAADIIPVNIYTFAKTLQAIFKFITVVKF